MDKEKLISDLVRRSSFEPSWTKKEIKSLPSILLDDETPVYILEGCLHKMHDKDEIGWGIVLLSNKRLLFYRKSIIGTVTREEYPLGRISSASFRKGLIFASIHIYSGGAESIIKNCNNSRGLKLVDELQKLLNKPEEIKGSNSTQIDSISEITKWHELKEKGIISSEEFERKKAQLLNL